MPRMRVTNGFPGIDGEGNILTGDLLNGIIQVGDWLIVDNKTRIPIIKVQELFEKKVAITISEEYNNAAFWLELYGKEFDIETS